MHNTFERGVPHMYTGMPEMEWRHLKNENNAKAKAAGLADG